MQATHNAAQWQAPERSLQIDLLKGITIFVVIFQHSMSGPTFHYFGAPIYLHQAVGMFLVLAGYNTAQSYARRGVHSLAAGYHWPALSRALLRLLVPYLLIWAIEALLSPARSILTAGDYLVALLTGGWGWGSYFIPIILANTLLFPLVYRFAQRAPALLLPAAFAASMAFELASYQLHLPNAVHEPIYLRYLFTVALGVWLATSRPSRGWLFGLAAFGLVFAYATEYHILQVPLNDAWASRAAPAAGLALGCVVIGLETLPARTSRLAWRVLDELGRASYHVFLVQGIYFWRFFHREPGLGEFLGAGLAIVLLGVLGWLFYRAELRLREAWGNWRRRARLAAGNNGAGAAADIVKGFRAVDSLVTVRSVEPQVPRLHSQRQPQGDLGGSRVAVGKGGGGVREGGGGPGA